MASTYIEILGSSAEAALAIPEIWNTPETSVPGAYSTVAMVKSVSKMLNQMGASVVISGDKNATDFSSTMKMRFGDDYASTYKWREIVEQLYGDVQAGRKLAGPSFLLTIPGPVISGIPVIPVAVGLLALWYFTKKG